MTAVVPDVNPTLARRELAALFSGLRDQRSRTVDEVAAFLGVSQSMASRLETGARGFKAGDAEKLADWYELGEPEKARVRTLADESRKRAWWQQVDLSNSYRSLIGFEQAATSMFEYTASVVPGLLQLPDYAEAAARILTPKAKAEDIDRAVSVRMERQRVLDRDEPPELSVVFDEAVLARGVGDQKIMSDQIRHLVEMAHRPNISVQVLPFDAGLYPTESAQFIILELPRGIPDFHYVEYLALPDKDNSGVEAVRDMKRLAERLRSIALDARGSEKLLSQYAERP